jgi:nitrogen regulatory protein PII
MKAVLLIYNQSVAEQIKYLLERLGINAYTMLDTVKGKGQIGNPRFGTHTWPELNSAILTVVPDNQLDNIMSAINKLDKINEEVGIKAFAWDILMSSDDFS